MSEPVWEDLGDADRPEWEREDGDHRRDHDDDPAEAPAEEVPPSGAPRDFEPRPFEPPYRSLQWPYVSREPYVANPNNLNKRELAALQRFFETREDQPR